MTGLTPDKSMRTFALLLGALGLGACGGSRGGPGVEASPHPDQGSAVDRGIAAAQVDSARYPYTEADIKFMSGMIHHHAQAIQMSRLAPTRAASPSVKTLAERIINAQDDEIRTMQSWLRDRRQPVPEPNPAGMKMTMNGTEHTMLMPGMLTPEQIKQLEQAKGLEFDQLFLTFMIQHHRGAIGMVKELFDSYGAGQDELVFKFASDVNVDQTTEVARMQRMLVVVTLERKAQQQ
jgi:uncharacterized protein (DUF305 family)